MHRDVNSLACVQVVTLRSNGGDSGEDSQPCSERSNRSNWSRVHAVDPHPRSSQRDGLLSRDQIGKEKKSSTNESTDNDRAQPLSEPEESEEAGIRIPCSPAAMVALDDMARDKGLPTSGGRESLSPR